jgi:hypothetical protein
MVRLEISNWVREQGAECDEYASSTNKEDRWYLSLIHRIRL